MNSMKLLIAMKQEDIDNNYNILICEGYPYHPLKDNKGNETNVFRNAFNLNKTECNVQAGFCSFRPSQQEG